MNSFLKLLIQLNIFLLHAGTSEDSNQWNQIPRWGGSAWMDPALWFHCVASCMQSFVFIIQEETNHFLNRKMQIKLRGTCSSLPGRNPSTSLEWNLLENIILIFYHSYSEKEKKKSCFKHLEVVCSIPSHSLLHPSYYHSFGLTENYIIFIEQPFRLDIVKMATAYIRGVNWASCLAYNKDDKVFFLLLSNGVRQASDLFHAVLFFIWFIHFSSHSFFFQTLTFTLHSYF